ncbi:transporter substrate-binding protein [Sulfitobacter guttiformis]|uniref:Amino acid/amide ABC transporter substrate-binding protein (HAAT family) n=1 Tax=Sulfitobacter guttiformis TaxID=74349 RepID=A0A420DI09_9RHOB|nr:transporter substrate-binding protein [Sulfitobacter guttiformis]KIN72383.1 Negative aliphatic amidase regulator [Sulfitobacter guttiformis KCTC 32187]RKE93861.1 amino acid/amide ABC transporter substrate-binding protein (HAAT family) [Sulfitobacter guttiformis]
MTENFDIGILYSRSGTYQLLSEALFRGAMAAVEAVNTDSTIPVTFTPVIRDPEGDLTKYAPLCAEILGTSSARHIVGCVTSSSRKEVIPELDRAGATLWYNVPYEGFETSARVVYSHAATNQNILPILGWAKRHFGMSAYLVGSNYIWGWETCRVARMRLEASGGAVLGERYLPLGDVWVEGLIREIERSEPKFIVNSLVGASSYAFIKAYAELGRRNPRFTAANCPILSCNLTEAELPALGDAAEGLISVGPSFCTTSAQDGRGSSLEKTAYQSVLTLAAVLARGVEGPFDSYLAENGARYGIDPATQHTTLDVHIAQVRGGAFQILHSWSDIAPDPYLTRPLRHPQFDQPILTVVRA